MILVNAVAIGFFAFTLVAEPLPAGHPLIRLRDGSLGFLALGVLLPALVLALFARRSRYVPVAMTLWMLTVLAAFFVYAAIFGGGV